MSPTRKIHPVITREVSSSHRTVESDKVGLVVHPAVQRSVVAISDKNLGVGANKRSIKMGQQFSRPPTAAGAEYAINRGVGKCLMQIIQAIFDRACVIEWSAIERVCTQNSFVTERVQLSDAAKHQVSLRCARRRKDRKSRARTQRTW